MPSHPRDPKFVLDIHVEVIHLGDMTPLAAYMKAKRLTDDKFATLVGRERSTITKLRLGQARPSLDLAIKIATISDGAVPATAYPDPKRAAREAAA